MTTTEDRAENTVRNFMALLNDGRDPDAVAALFAPDAHFWGTSSPRLCEGTTAIRDYFAEAFGRRMGRVVAGITQISAANLSDMAVVLAGRWEMVRGENVNRLRFTMVLSKQQNGRWLIAQFHSSRRPDS